MLTINRLSYRYRNSQQASLDNVSLSVPSGSLYGLLGPNGAGKSTLLNIICGQLAIQGGEISPDETLLTSDIALVPQDFAFYDGLRVGENIKLFAGLINANNASIDRTIDICQLGKHLNKYATQLSGGLKRRLNLAIGLLGQPKLLLLDEPTVGIDPQSRRFILDSVAKLNASGTSIIYTSHYMEEVEQLCDHIAILDDGHVIKESTLASLRQLSAQALIVTLQQAANLQQLSALHNLGTVHQQGLTLTIESDKLPQNVPAILQSLMQHELQIQSLHWGEQRLESLFMDLTSKTLRD